MSFAEKLADFTRIYCKSNQQHIQHLIDSAAGDESKTISLLESQFDAYGFFAAPYLNFTSKYFDPLRALYDETLTPPIVLASPLENVHKAITLLPSHLASHFDVTNVHLGPLHSAEVGELDRDRWRGEPPPSLLEWLINDAMNASTDSIISSSFSSSMSWSMLRTLCKQRAQVRVHVSWGKNKGENEEEVGTLTGYLRGFDRHRSILLLNHKWEKRGKEDEESLMRLQIQGARAILIKGSDIVDLENLADKN
jgi:hypothetical protein